MLRPLRIALRVLLILAAIGIAPMLVLSLQHLRSEQEKAHERYRQTLTDLERTTAALNGVEGRLQQLTGSVEAVEHEARVQLQLVKPGEHLILIQHQAPLATAGL